MEKIQLDNQRSKVLQAEKQKLMAMRSQTKEKAAATKLEIMQKFEKLRKRGIKQEDLKVLGFDELTEKYQSIPDLHLD